jgi:hypothetical protein
LCLLQTSKQPPIRILRDRITNMIVSSNQLLATSKDECLPDRQ